jgi:hypothetical protein
VLDLVVPLEEMEMRRAALTPPGRSGESGRLGVYERTVGPLPGGATLNG